MNAAESRHILFILGMHRSGTSALCAALQACGGSFGRSLLAPMDGVNDEGFWEDTDVVQLNERLLEQAGVCWYSATADVLEREWSGEAFSELRLVAREIMQRGFGDGPLEVVKDPRFCLTLPLWLAVAADLGIKTSACVMSRSPMEVARSLEKRDGFPPAYGLRLLQTYRRGISRFAPPDTLELNYPQLLADPCGVMGKLAQRLPLTVDEASLGAAVRGDLRHQLCNLERDQLSSPDLARDDIEAVDQAIAAKYPCEQALAEFAECVVSRGEQLTRIGTAHSNALATLAARDADITALSAEHRRALATLDERDSDIAGLSDQHRTALATLDERDEQIREFDRRLAKLGEEHSHALQVVRERDAQLEYIYNLPGIGLVVRLLKKNAQG